MSAAAAAAPPAALTEALQGWRAWQVVAQRDGTVGLRSLWVNVAWPAGRPLQSGCSLHGPRVVAWHVCGIHAFADRAELEGYIGRRPAPAPRLHGDDRALGIAVGRVCGWGRAICHERGWRSQLAYPYALYLPSGDKGVARALADRYAVETAPFAPMR